MKNLRSIEVSVAIPNVKYGSKGHFHKWCVEFIYDHTGYPLRKTFALIEFQDGSVKLLHPETIRFLEPRK
jgi:hypothetical protein